MTIQPLTILPQLIDHTLVKPEATEREIIALCHEAMKYRFGAVCINPSDVESASMTLAGTGIGIVSVVSFPLGQCLTETKVAQAVTAVDHGATEIDMVANRGLLFDGKLSEYETDIRKVRENLPKEIVLKVILEIGRLSLPQTRQAVKAAISAGAEFVKTGTGYLGACTPEHVETLSTISDGRIKVKASGGIKTVADCDKMLRAGAARIGTSVAVSIMQEWQTR